VTVVHALRDISLELREGDRLGITGHNGSGKSTLLRVIAGVYPPTRGRIERTGSVSSLIDPMLGIEMDATGYENIRLRGLIAGMRLAAIKSITPQIADFSGLGDYLSIPVRTYSTGMLMRLAFSIATAVHTDILIMDEWMSVGDADFKAQAEERLREVIDNTGILVLASHQADLIERECNRGIVLSHGAIVQDRPIGPIEPTIRLVSAG
jgi:lipopolysaccharide transport system ATP-binding protein